MKNGAIGYLENDEENLKIFDVIANALKKNGKHFMNICNAEHAEMHFPKRYWDIGILERKSLHFQCFIGIKKIDFHLLRQ
ncbi:hypothetical protein [Sporomusa aerivorans]|uniref:hypothetical protein n=1 Tax=Sporomusa aerivorans TaxID=204936 RepID=UPI00352BC155